MPSKSMKITLPHPWQCCSNSFFASLLLGGSLLCLHAATLAAQVVAPPTNRELSSPEIERRVNELLGQMTLEEKLGQLVLYNSDGYAAHALPAEDAAIAANPQANFRLNSMERVEVDMMSHFYDTELPGLVNSGRVSINVIDEAVRRVLRVKFALGLFEHPFPSTPEVTAAVPEHRPLVRQAAEESFVLLQDNPIAGTPLLPLKPGVKLALIGPLADDGNEMQGAWGGAHRAADVITLKSALDEFTKTNDGSVVTVKGTEISGNSDADFSVAEAAAQSADVVVMALGESSAMSGEAGSRTCAHEGALRPIVSKRKTPHEFSCY